MKLSALSNRLSARKRFLHRHEGYKSGEDCQSANRSDCPTKTKYVRYEPGQQSAERVPAIPPKPIDAYSGGTP